MRAGDMISGIQHLGAGLVLGRIIDAGRAGEVAGPRANKPPAWAPARAGWPRRPLEASVALPAGVLGPVPMVVRVVRGRYNSLVEVFCHADDLDAGADALEQLTNSQGTDNPLHGGIYATSLAPASSLQLRPVPPEDVRAERLQLPEGTRAAIETNVDRFFATAERWRGNRLGLHRGVMLVGPPGCGKSALCRSIADRLRGQCTIFLPGASSLSVIGIRELYAEAQRLAPSIVILDDFDRTPAARSGMDVREALSVLDGVEQRSTAVLTLGTANHLGVFDEAMLRAARFDVTIQLGLPDAALRERILGAYVRPAGFEEDLSAVVRRTGGASGADLRELVRLALLNADGDVSLDDLLAAVEDGRWRNSGSTGFYL